MRQEGEPSVEEILESIKRVIARDNRETLEAERRRRTKAGVAARSEDAEEAEDVLELGDEQAAGHEDEAVDDGLTTEDATRTMRESLAALAVIAEPGAQPQIVRSGETSLEELTRDLLRPMLAQWLDDNLPGMVERLVRDEIARIAGKRG